jgi:hypothetical protein
VVGVDVEGRFHCFRPDDLVGVHRSSSSSSRGLSVRSQVLRMKRMSGSLNPSTYDRQSQLTLLNSVQLKSSRKVSDLHGKNDHHAQNRGFSHENKS